MCPRIYILLAIAVVVMAARALASDRPKLPRGLRCRVCMESRLANPNEKLSYMAVDQREEEVPFGDALVQRLVQRRSPYWPLKHPALALDARKRHREAPTFLHPVVRFVQPPFNELGGPFVGGDEGWEEPRPLSDNHIRDGPGDRVPMTAEDLIRALQEQQWRQLEEDGPKVNTVRFGGIGRK